MELIKCAIRYARSLPFLIKRTQAYERLYFPNYDLLFHLDPLEDTRGIGRMTSELLTALRLLSIQPPEKVTPKKPIVYFYSTIHWCPKRLPRNSVAYVLDVIPLLFPDLFPSAAKTWRKVYQKKALQAAKVIGISRSGLVDSIRLLGLDERRTAVVPCGVTRFLFDETHSSTSGIEGNFCFVGTPSHHKNLNVVLQALALPEAKRFSLSLIGNRHEELLPLIRQLRIESRVRLLGRLDDNKIAHLLSSATALVFPSLYEGFGLPPLEAALLGTPSICSRRPAMDELLEGAAVFCEPDNPAEWARAMARLADSPEECHRLGLLARERAKIMTWRNAAQQLLPHFEEVAGKQPSA